MPEKLTDQTYRCNLDDENPGLGWYETRLFADGKWSTEVHLNLQNVADGREPTKEGSQKRAAANLRKLADLLEGKK